MVPEATIGDKEMRANKLRSSVDYLIIPQISSRPLSKKERKTE
jgi:hypothetical protein